MSTKVAQTPAVRVSRLLKAPRERVFAAWTTPADILKWFSPETCRIISAEADLRVGGSYHFRVANAEYGELDLRGVYRDVKAPAKLAFTWSWSGSPELEFGETLVKVNFADKEGFTEVQLTHGGFPNMQLRNDHEHGWRGCLDKLETLLGAGSADQSACPPTGAFCWNELLATDTGKATEFYGRLFGWKAAAFPGGMDYSVFKLNGQEVGGLMKRPGNECPPHWLAYVKVDNVDASAKTATDLGAKVLLPPTDIPTVGRIAVFQDPQGAALGIFQPAQ